MANIKKKLTEFQLNGGPQVMKKYGLTKAEATALVFAPNYIEIRDRVELWRQSHGFPATNSPLVRGYLLDVLTGRL